MLIGRIHLGTVRQKVFAILGLDPEGQKSDGNISQTKRPS